MATNELETTKIDDKLECNICLQKLDVRQATRTICGHYYHKNCLCEWFNSRLHLPPTCPTCRGDLRYEKGIMIYYDLDKMDLKLIQNPDGDYFFYPNRFRKYFLKINRINDTIVGGVLYNKTNTKAKIITEEMLEQNQEKFNRLRLDETYEIFEEL